LYLLFGCAAGLAERALTMTPVYLNGIMVAAFKRHEDASHYLTMLMREAIVKGYEVEWEGKKMVVVSPLMRDVYDTCD
jgi:predicted metal-dependent RNase